MRTLAESANYAIVHEFEDVFILEKSTGRTIGLGSHYGDPQVGLIAPDESWFAAGGEGITFYDRVHGFHEFLRGRSVVAQEPVNVRYEDPQTGDVVALEATHRIFDENVAVRALNLLPDGNVEIVDEESGSRWLLNPRALTVFER